ncbi:hypothetical protein BH09BAC2_BH09BAC2_21270 [soil metagenome]
MNIYPNCRSLIFTFFILVLTISKGFAQNPSVEVTSTSGGFVAPSMTLVQRTALSNYAGTIVYQNNLAKGYYYNDGTKWIFMGGSTSITYFTTGGAGITGGVFVYAIGFPITITVPENCNVFLSGDIGALATGATTLSFDFVMVMDGGYLPAGGGYQRWSMNATAPNQFRYGSMSQTVVTTPGSHTFGLAGINNAASGNSVTFGGAAGSVLQGELTVTFVQK